MATTNRFKVLSPISHHSGTVEPGAVVRDVDFPGVDFSRLIKAKVVEPIGRYTPPPVRDNPHATREELIEDIGRLQLQKFGDESDDEYETPKSAHFATDDPGSRSQVRGGTIGVADFKAAMDSLRRAIQEDLREELGNTASDHEVQSSRNMVNSLAKEIEALKLECETAHKECDQLSATN